MPALRPRNHCVLLFTSPNESLDTRRGSLTAMGSSQSTPAASNMYTATAASDVAAAAATALTLHPTSAVKGQHFDRYVQVFFENQDYAIAEGDPNFAYLATLGVKLDNYWSITHPSQPNYVAALGADRNGVLLDNFVQIDESVETVIDLLDAGGVSWSIYGEDQPFSGFEADWVNQETGANMYVRKHNVSFTSPYFTSPYMAGFCARDADS